MTMTNAKINTIQLQATQHKGEAVEEILVDGEVISTDYTIDFSLLAMSAQASGSFFLLTCSCGAESCIGLYEGDEIKVTHTDSTIKWDVAEPEPAPERTFVFDKKQYIAAIMEFFKAVDSDKPKYSGTLIGVFGYDVNKFNTDFKSIKSLAKNYS